MGTRGLVQMLSYRLKYPVLCPFIPAYRQHLLCAKFCVKHGWVIQNLMEKLVPVYLQARQRTGSALANNTRAASGEGYRLSVPSSDVTAVPTGRKDSRSCRTKQSASQEELEHSLGESAAQGAAGVVVWVSSEETKTKVSRGLGRGGRRNWPTLCTAEVLAKQK